MSLPGSGPWCMIRARLVDVECAIRKRQAPPGGDQRVGAAALGKHAQSVRNWTRQGMPVERVGRFCRYATM